MAPMRRMRSENVCSYWGYDAVNDSSIVNQKVERIKAAIGIKDYDRPPVVALAEFWPTTLIGKYTMQEVFYDIDKLGECYIEAFKQFPDWDSFGAVLYSLGPMLDATGSKRYSIPGQTISADTDFQHPDLVLMDNKDYPKLIEDPVKFQVQDIIPKLCTKLAAPEPARSKALIKAAMYYSQWVMKQGMYTRRWRDELGVPALFQGTAIYMPMDWIADKLRGFMNALMDIKRIPATVQEACEALIPFISQVGFSTAVVGGDYPLLFNPQHVSPFISPKDYEKCYWPSYKKVLDGFFDKGYRVYSLLEGCQEQHLEKLQELPKGKIVLQFEKSDLKLVKKYLGGRVCVAGGMPGSLLVKGTPEEVKSCTLEVLDLFADVGGFIMTCDMLLPTNAKPENIRAWLDTVVNYR